MNKEHLQNSLAWNEASIKYRLDMDENYHLLSSGGNSLTSPELNLLKSMKFHYGRCIHLQCAGGTDSLSFLNLGFNEVVGIDIASEMIAIAQEKTKKLKMNASWYNCDILDTPNELNETADLVYTGQGAINWITDITAWAKVIYRLLKPGAAFFIFEGHPITYLFDRLSPNFSIDPDYKGYFSKELYISQDWPETYVGKIKDGVKEQQRKFERVWPIYDVINAIIKSGLILEEVREYPDKYWDEFPNFPEEVRTLFPNTFSIVAKKI